jgi:hypothetical protein
MLAGGSVASAVPVGKVRVSTGGRLVDAQRFGDASEAWYSTAPSLCLPIVGCVTAPVSLPSIYPAGTLHVGVTAGAGSARTFITPDIPDPTKSRQGAVPYDGKLVLPVDMSLLAGTVAASSAHIKACLVTGKPRKAPSTTGPTTGAMPTIDCRTSATATYDQAKAQFVVGLERFLTKWRHGVPNRGVALIPVVGALGTWQVTFDGSHATGSHIYTLVGYAACHGCNLPVPPSARPTTSPSSIAVPPTEVVPPPATGIETAVPPAAPPQLAPTSAVYLIRSKGFRYPAIFIAPLAILAGVIFFSRLFTGSTVRPRRLTMGADETNA